MKKIKYTIRRKNKRLNVFWFIIFLITFIVSTSTAYSLYHTELNINASVIGRTEYNYYFEMPKSWLGSKVYCYLWNEDAEGNVIGQNAPEFTEAEMTLVDSATNTYCYTVTRQDPNYGLYNHVFFTTDEYTKNTTIDLAFDPQMNNKVFKIEPHVGKKRLYVTNITWDKAYIYLKQSLGSWENRNGTLMTKVADSTYVYDFDSKYKTVIFRQNSSYLSVIFASGITIPDESDMTYDMSTKKWSKIFFDGNWYDYIGKK